MQDCRCCQVLRAPGQGHFRAPALGSLMAQVPRAPLRTVIKRRLFLMWKMMRQCVPVMKKVAALSQNIVEPKTACVGQYTNDKQQLINNLRGVLRQSNSNEARIHKHCKTTIYKLFTKPLKDSSSIDKQHLVNNLKWCSFAK